MELVYWIGMIGTIVYMTFSEKNNKFFGFMIGIIACWIWPVLALIYLYAVMFKKDKRT